MRRELKYIISPQEYIVLKNICSKIMKKDSHANENGEYLVKSIYFENYLHETINQKKMDLDNISKYRIRMYQNDEESIFLERKTNSNNVITKNSEKIDRSLVNKLLLGNYYGLLGKSSLKDALYLQMAIKQYRPFIMIQYTRTAFIDENSNTRITIDTDIKSTINCEKFFEETEQLKKSNEIILEIKYDKYIPNYIKETLKGLDKKQVGNSKYTKEVIKYGI